MYIQLHYVYQYTWFKLSNEFEISKWHYRLADVEYCVCINVPRQTALILHEENTWKVR